MTVGFSEKEGMIESRTNGSRDSGIGFAVVGLVHGE